MWTRAAAAMLSYDDPVDAPGGLDRGQAEAARRRSASARSAAARDRAPCGRRGRSRDRNSRARRLASVTVGSRAAAAVAGRAGIGAGGVRADLQQPDLVDRGDRAAAGADLDHVDDRRLDRQAGALLEAMDARRLPASARSRRAPSSIRQALAVVPPMSKEITSVLPAAAPKKAVARPPPAGPDSSRRIGKARAVSGETQAARGMHQPQRAAEAAACSSRSSRCR